MLTWIFELNVLKKNVKVRTSALVCIPPCAMKDIFFTCEVKCERDCVKELGIQEMKN